MKFRFLALAAALFAAEPAFAGPILFPTKIIDAGSMAGNLTSSTFTVAQYSNLGIQMVWTGTPTGTFDIQGSNDNSNWSSITITSMPAPAGSASNGLLDMNQVSFMYVRLVYTRTSGTGTLNVTVTAKVL